MTNEIRYWYQGQGATIREDTPAETAIDTWPIKRLVEYARNPLKNDAAVDRMCSSIRQFGFKIPVILCDACTPAQVKAFRLMVNRSVSWADWDEELLAQAWQEIQKLDFDLSFTGFDTHEIDSLLALDDEEKGNAAPPLPESPVSQVGRPLAFGALPRWAIAWFLPLEKWLLQTPEQELGGAGIGVLRRLLGLHASRTVHGELINLRRWESGL